MAAAIIGAVNVRTQPKATNAMLLSAIVWGVVIRIVCLLVPIPKNDISLQYGGYLEILTVIIYLITVVIHIHHVSIL